MMESNGQPGEHFDLAYGKLLQSLEAEGFDADRLQGLRTKIQSISALLQTYRIERRQLGDSGKFSAPGLLQVEAELAAKIAGEIRKLTDTSLLAGNIRQHEETLRPKPTSDATERLITMLRQQEIRYAVQGLTGNDPFKADELYRDALRDHNVELMESLENWPIRCPVSAELVAEGQRQRAAAVDPVIAKARDELLTLKQTIESAARDAIAELPLKQADQLQQIASGESHEQR